MILLAFVLPLLLMQAPPSEALAVSQPGPPDCHEWHECRQLALEAATRGDYETFHDLAWRAIQTGPKNDPALMYMLARAQSLSGRPHDALVMLERLADMGVAADAMSDDFQRVRALPGWPEVNALIERARSSGAAVPTPAATLSPAARAEPAPAPPPRRVSAVFKPEPVERAVHIPTPPFSAGGLAYDSVSDRFVVGDVHGRKLIIIEKGADHAVDLVRAESAGFHEIRALEIDHRQGDLWVATATPDDREWTIHKLQLVSGRPLKAVAVAESLAPMKLVDLAIGPAGAVLAVDAAGNRLLELPARGTSLKPVLHLDVKDPTSIAATSERGVVYLAHAGGVSRVDLTTAKAAPVDVPAGLELGRIERLRWHRNALFAVQIDARGSRQLVRFDLNASGRAVIASVVIDTTIPAEGGPTFATISGDDLFYVAAASETSGESQTPGPVGEFTIRRVRLR